MTISDIFKNDFINQTTGALSLLEMSMTLIIAFLVGVGIYYVYKRNYQGVMYSRTFNTSLVVLSLISATIIIGVTNNIVLSLGMVGALSIVRFRTSIKDPMDVVFMFWAIGTGIITGAGLYVLSGMSFLIIAGVVSLFSKMEVKLESYLIIISYNEAHVEKEIFNVIESNLSRYKIKSKTKISSQYELTVEIRTKTDKRNIVDEIDRIQGIISVAMLSYDGDFAL